VSKSLHEAVLSERYLRRGYEGHLQKKKTKPMVTLASAHPDHRTVSVAQRKRFSKMTYKALQVYDKASGSVAEHRAGKPANTHGLPMKAMLFQSNVMMDMPGRQIKITQVLRPFTQEISSRTEARAISEELIDGL